MFCDEDDICSHLGITYVSSNSDEFIKELLQYKCPIRATEYLDNSTLKYYVLNYIVGAPDIVIDFSETHADLCRSLKVPYEILTEPQKYIAYTPHLDRYGNILSVQND